MMHLKYPEDYETKKKNQKKNRLHAEPKNKNVNVNKPEHAGVIVPYPTAGTVSWEIMSQ